MVIQNLGMKKIVEEETEKTNQHVNKCRLWISMNSAPDLIDIVIFSFFFFFKDYIFSFFLIVHFFSGFRFLH